MHTEKQYQYNDCTSLKRLIAAERKITKRTTAVSKRSTQYHNNLDNATKKTEQQKQQYDNLCDLATQHHQRLNKCAEFVKTLEAKLATTIQRNAAMQLELKQRKEQRTATQCNKQELLCSMRVLKEATGTYINHNALPARIQGIFLPHGYSLNVDQWFPFNFKASNACELHGLWQHLQTRNTNASKWRELISVDQQVGRSSEKEDAENMGPIIDLTSSMVI